MRREGVIDRLVRREGSRGGVTGEVCEEGVRGGTEGLTGEAFQIIDCLVREGGREGGVRVIAW